MDTHSHTTHSRSLHRRQKQEHEQTQNQNKLMPKHTSTDSGLLCKPSESFWPGEMWVTWLDYRQDTMETDREVLACSLRLPLYPPSGDPGQRQYWSTDWYILIMKVLYIVAYYVALLKLLANIEQQDIHAKRIEDDAAFDVISLPFNNTCFNKVYIIDLCLT